MTASTLEAIIFDVDGTLAETEEAHRHAFNRAFSEHGLKWRWSKADYKRLLKTAGGKERLSAFIAEIGFSPPGGQPLDSFVSDLHRRKTQHYAASLESGALGLRPGVAELIDECRKAGVRMAIATTTSLANVTGLLAATLGGEAIGFFDAIAAGDSVRAKKPAPDVYLQALDALGLAPGVCLAIEDSSLGLLAARSAGIATLITPSAYTCDDDFTGALHVTPSLEAMAKPPETGILAALSHCFGERGSLSG